MQNDSSTTSWNEISKEWCDIAPINETRNCFIMPYMLRLIGDVTNLKVLDLGCGEGGYARTLARNGADVTAVDCAKFSIEYAINKAREEQVELKHKIRNCNDLYGISDQHFDIVLCSMMLMDCEDLDGTVKEIRRVLKPNGKLYASVLHPCFTGGKIRRVGKGMDRKVIVEDYFHPREYSQPLPGGSIDVIWRHRTIEEYVKVFVGNGLSIIDLNEARPRTEEAQQTVFINWLNKIPIFMYWVLEKNM